MSLVSTLTSTAANATLARMALRSLAFLLLSTCVFMASVAWGQGSNTATTPTTPTIAADAAAGRMLYRDTPLLRGSLQACVQCHANPVNQVRGFTLSDQQDHIRCAIQGGCGGNVLAVYPFGGMGQFQGRLDTTEIRQLATYIRNPVVSSAYPRLSSIASGTFTASIGGQSTRALVLENLGELPLTLGQTRRQGDGTLEIVQNACTPGRALAPGQRCELTVRFAPVCEVPQSAALRIAHDGPMGTSTLQINAIASGAAPAAAVLSANALQFKQMAAQAITFTNACGGELQLRQASVSGAFRLASGPDACEGRALKAGQSCQIWLEPMASLASAVGIGELVLWHSASTIEHRVALSRVFEAQLLADAQQTRVDGSTTVGERRAWLVARLSNPTAVTQTFAGLSASSAEFSLAAAPAGADPLANACAAGQRIASGQACDLWLAFAPTAPGERTATVSALAPTGGALTTLSVAGAAVAALNPSPASANPPAQTGGGAVDWPLALLLMLWAVALWRLHRR